MKQHLTISLRNNGKAIARMAVILLWGSGSIGFATDYYVSPIGSSSGNGTILNPWSLSAALQLTQTIKPGDTLYLREGTYQTTSQFIPFRVSFSGTPTQPVTIRPYANERAIINGTMEVLGPGLIIRDLEVMSTDTRRLSSQVGPFPTDVYQGDGIDIYAPNVKLINNLVHDTANGLSAFSASPDSELYGNLIYYNGWLGADRPHGTGIYAQNTTGLKFLEDNIIHDNFSEGMQVYGSVNASIKNFRILGNIVFENGSPTGQYSRNILVGGGSPVLDSEVRDNFSMYLFWGDTANLGYYNGGAGCLNMAFTGNYLFGGTFSLLNCQFGEMKDNVINSEMRSLMPTNPVFPGNFFGRPTNTVVRVRPNRYEQGRANIVILNWAHQSTVAVDISQIGLTIGDAYEIRNVQDYFGDVMSGIYDGKPVTIDMNPRRVASPVGWSTPPSTFPAYGTFLIRRVSTAGPIAPSAILPAYDGSTATGGGTGTPPENQSYSVATATASASPGTGIATSWTAPAGTATNDWIGLFAVGAPNTSYLAYQFTGGATNGSRTFVAPTQPGEYEFRYLLNNGFTDVARSSAVTVGTTVSATLPVLSAVQASPATSAATITWISNVAVDSQVEYGVSASYGSQSALDPAKVTAHTVLLSGLTPATMYHFRVKGTDGSGNVALSGDVTFTTLPPAQIYTLTATPASANPGSPLSLTWTAPIGRPASDWIGLFAVGAANNVTPLWSQFTSGAIIGTVNVPAPVQSGQYEFRYYQQNQATPSLSSNTITIVVPTSYSVTGSPSTVAPSGVLTVNWTAPAGRPGLDWVGLFQVGAPNTTYLWYRFTGGTKNGSTYFTAPAQPGQYEFRYLLNGGYTDAARSAPITVQ